MMNKAWERNQGHITVGLKCKKEKLGYDLTRQWFHGVLNGDIYLAVVENMDLIHRTFLSLQEGFSCLGEIKLCVWQN